MHHHHHPSCNGSFPHGNLLSLVHLGFFNHLLWKITLGEKWLDAHVVTQPPVSMY